MSTSMVGAGVGTGALSTPTPESGRSVVSDRLAAQRDGMEAKVTSALIDDMVKAMMSTTPPNLNPPILDPLEQDRFAWKRVEPKIPFESRNAEMTTDMRTKIEGWLDAFQQQWSAWKDRSDVRKKAREYELEANASAPFSDPIDVLADLIGIGTPAEAYFDMATKDIPFQFAPPGD